MRLQFPTLAVIAAFFIHFVMSICVEEDPQDTLPDLYLQGAASSRCVGVHGYNLDNGGLVDLWDCVRSAHNELWNYNFTGYLYQEVDPMYQLISSSSGKCLTAGTGGANMAPITQTDCSPFAMNQFWYPKLNASDPLQFQFIGGESQRCLTALGSFNGAKLVLYDCLGWGWPGQLWHSDIRGNATTS